MTGVKGSCRTKYSRTIPKTYKKKKAKKK